MKITRFHIISALGISLSCILLGSFFFIMNQGGSFSSRISSDSMAINQDNQTRLNFTLSDLNLSQHPTQIQFTTSGRVEVDQGPFSLTIFGDQQALDQIEIRTSNELLSIIPPRGTSFIGGDKLEIYLSIPSINQVSLIGAGTLLISNFSQDQLGVTLDGAGTLTLEQGLVKQLNLQVRGVGKVDVKDFIAINSSVDLEGAASVTLEMGGGILTGKLEGLGSLQYRGTVEEENVTIRGLGSVRRKD